MPQFTARQRSYIRKKSKPPEHDASVGGELNIVPFLDIVINLIMFLLMTTASVVAIAQLDAQLPTLSKGVGKSSGDSGNTLNLSITVAETGVFVAGSGGKLAPGCATTTTGPTPTVAKTNKGYDWQALTDCVAKVKSVEEFQDETQVIVTADPMVQFEVLVMAMDAVRGSEDKLLFPDVLLSAGVR